MVRTTTFTLSVKELLKERAKVSLQNLNSPNLSDHSSVNHRRLPSNSTIGSPTLTDQDSESSYTPTLSHSNHSNSDYSPSIGSVKTAVVLGSGIGILSPTTGLLPESLLSSGELLAPESAIPDETLLTRPEAEFVPSTTPTQTTFLSSKLDPPTEGSSIISIHKARNSSGSSSGDSLLDPLHSHDSNRLKSDSTEKLHRIPSYLGPKMKLISPPPWTETDEEPWGKSLHRINGSEFEPPASPSPVKGSGRSGTFRNFLQRSDSGLPSPPSPTRSDEPLQNSSFLDLSNTPTKSFPSPRLPGRRRKNSLASPKLDSGKKLGFTPDNDAPAVPILPEKSSPPPSSSIDSLTSTVEMLDNLPPSESIPSTTSVSIASLASNLASPSASVKSNGQGMNLISLETARERERHRIRRQNGTFDSNLSSELDSTPQRSLKNKKSGFLRMFKKSDENVDRSPSPLTPEAPLPAPPSKSPRMSPGLSVTVAPTSSIRIREGGMSAPPGQVTFLSSARDGPKAGLAPSLSLRPVSMAFSHAIPQSLLTSNSEDGKDGASPRTASYDTNSEGKSSPPTTPGFPPSLYSPLSSTFTSSPTVPMPGSLQDQLNKSKQSWKSQLWELETQVRTLQTEIESLRSERALALTNADPDFKACETCGCSCVARKMAISVVQRPRPKGLEGDRVIFGGGRE